MRSTLTVAEVARMTGWPVRTVRRRFAAWLERGWPLVTYRRGSRGNARGVLVVDAAELRACFAGNVTEHPAEAA